jgi:hypothetical protein
VLLRCGLLFDLDDEDRLKVIPNRGAIVPKLCHLKEEAVRRAALYDIRPIRKAARKDELIGYLKANPVHEELDVTFLRREANRTYQRIVQHNQAQLDLEREALASKNWIGANYLRLYHSAIDDRSRPFMVAKDDCMDRLELDGRNSEERPPTWYEKIAELYNDPANVYVMSAIPDLDEYFAHPMTPAIG